MAVWGLIRKRNLDPASSGRLHAFHQLWLSTRAQPPVASSGRWGSLRVAEFPHAGGNVVFKKTCLHNKALTSGVWSLRWVADLLVQGLIFRFEVLVSTLFALFLLKQLGKFRHFQRCDLINGDKMVFGRRPSSREAEFPRETVSHLPRKLQRPGTLWGRTRRPGRRFGY